MIPSDHCPVCGDAREIEDIGGTLYCSTVTMKSATLDQARTAKEHVKAAFAKSGRVVGVGIARSANGYVLKVNLESALEPGVTLPKDVNGVPVQIEIVGAIRKR